MKSQILLCACLSIFLMACGQTSTNSTKASIEGAWQTNEGYFITILSDGKNENRYLFIMDEKELMGEDVSFIEQKGDSLVFFNKGDGHRSTVKKYTVTNDSLIIAGNFEPTRAKRINSEVPNRDLNSIALDPNSFFDYSTDKYFAGTFFDLTPKASLPFYINKQFIEKNKIDSISFVVATKNTKGDSVYDYKEEGAMSYFFVNGLTQKMTLTKSKRKNPSVVWNYHYSKNEILDSISMYGGSLKFNSNGWGFDRQGNKTWQRPEQILFWNYKDGYPVIAVSYGGFAKKTSFTYKYNAQHQLIEIEERWWSSTTADNSYLLEYSSIGTLKKMTKVTHYN